MNTNTFDDLNTRTPNDSLPSEENELLPDEEVEIFSDPEGENDALPPDDPGIGEPIEGPEPVNRKQSILGNQKVAVGAKRVNLDVTAVIDCTGSMSPMIDVIKHNVLDFKSLVMERLEEQLVSKRPDRVLGKLRIRVVAFRDYNYDWMAAEADEREMRTCPFCDLDNQEERQVLSNFVNTLTAAGGEDIPESGLEGLHFAINSEWDRSPTAKHRHVIMLFTDAPAIDLADPRNVQNVHYPSGMPKSLEALQAEYSDDAIIGTKDQRMFLFAPESIDPSVCIDQNGNRVPVIDWKDVADWNGAELLPIQPDGGLADTSLEMIVASLTGSLL